MKKLSKILICGCIMFALMLGGCGGGRITLNDNVTLPQGERFDNPFPNSQYKNGWSREYGVGDPYLLRHNGMYYLYISTPDFGVGVKMWTSRDLVNFEYGGNVFGLQGDEEYDFVGKSQEYLQDFAAGAYAPEVYYFNGKFYMYTSLSLGTGKGLGHYIYTSDSPSGKFTRVSQNLGKSIDGSVFIDDDEKMYFLTANDLPGSINLYTMSDMETIDGVKTPIGATSLGGWTEAPYMIKRDGIYYMSFSGNHVLSPAYRVGYVSGVSPTELESPGDNSLLLSTEEDFQGLGHNAMFVGPDLDSTYTAYHNLVSIVGPQRQYNMSRLFFNGSAMTADGLQNGNFKPRLPVFMTDGADTSKFDTAEGKTLTKDAAQENFAAEYNFTAKTDLYAAYTDEDNYLKIVLKGNGIYLVQRAAGAEKTIGSGTLKNDFDFSVLHTVKIEKRGSKINVYFDNMRKISANVTVGGGKIGYGTTDAEHIKFTCFNNSALGMGDAEFTQAMTSEIYAVNHLSGDGRGYRYGAGAVKQIPFDEDTEDENFSHYVGQNSLRLKKGEYVRYGVDVTEDGFYGLSFLMSAASGGETVDIFIDNNTPLTVKVPKNASDTAQFFRATLLETELTKGLHTIAVAARKNFEFVGFRGFVSSKYTPDYANDLSKFDAESFRYLTDYKIIDGGHYVKSGYTNICVMSDTKLTDFSIECDIKILAGGNGSAGFMLRESNATLAYDNQVRESIRGYYVSLNDFQVTLRKYDFSAETMATKTMPVGGGFVTVKAQIKGNTITVFINGEKVIEEADSMAFAHGAAALYSNGSEAVYKNLKIKGV